MLSSKTRRWSAAGLIFIGVLAGVIFASNFNWTTRGLANRKIDDPIVLGNQESADDAILQLQNTGKAFTAISKDLLPTVVSIGTERIVRRSNRDQDNWGEIFRDFFGREFRGQVPETQRQQGLGSGVIVSEDGYILTNNHVLENADDIKVTLYDNRIFEGELIGTDPLTEVAILKIDGKDLPVVRLGDSEKIEIGEWVLAFGNPLGLSSTVTAGIVSAKGRDINIIQDASAGQRGGSYAIENFIQTDAAINPGNSGGPLVNLKAEVIGINTAIATRTGYYQGYGFAIPINLAKKIMNDLIEKGYVTRAWLGIGMNDVSEAAAERFGLDRPKGVLISQVMEDSPAAKAGLEELDILMQIEGKEVNHGNEIQNIIALKNPGDTVLLKILRNGKEKNVRVKLGQRDTGRETAQVQEEDELNNVGLTVEPLTSEIRSRLGHDYYDGEDGVIVTSVENYGAAYDAAIRARDLLVRIEDTPIRSKSDYRRAIRSFEKGKVVIFYLKRGNADFHAFVKIPE